VNGAEKTATTYLMTLPNAQYPATIYLHAVVTGCGIAFDDCLPPDRANVRPVFVSQRRLLITSVRGGGGLGDARFLFTCLRYKFECAGSFPRMQDRH
jgi:hypothetical protein